MSATVAANKVVIFHYTLTRDDGEVLDTSAGRDPMPYLHGRGNIVPGLEEQMEGRVPGDKFVAVVSPEKGYGPKTGPGPQPVPRSQFPLDVEIVPGMQFGAQTPDGQQVALFVAKVDDKEVWVDQNHPLSGVTLNFAVEIVTVRDANANELAHGHPHGIDGTGGHHH